MTSLTFTLIAMLVAGFAAAAAALVTHSHLIRKYKGTIAQLEGGHTVKLEATGRELGVMQATLDQAKSILADLSGQLSHLEQENLWLNEKLEERPFIVKKVYRILTVGMKGTGKTSLTLKWANPIIDLGQLEGTQRERYERTVSQVEQKSEQMMTQHLFEIRDWGGEHIVDAQHEFVMEEIHGLLIVVDLGGRGATSIEPERVELQLRQFQSEALQFFFGSKELTSCKTVVLFINKSDLLPGTPAEVEAQARQLYKPLIDNLSKYSTRVDIRILVGSSSYGHSTHHLFSHFVEKILPRSAYDPQLLQRWHPENELSGREAPEGEDSRSGNAGVNGAAAPAKEDGVDVRGGADVRPSAPIQGVYSSALNGAAVGSGAIESTVRLPVRQ